MNSEIKLSVSRSIFFLSPYLMGVFFVGIIFLLWGIFYSTGNIFWWTFFMVGNLFLIFLFFYILVFFSLRIFFDEESIFYVDSSNIFYPQKKSLLFKEITKVTFEQKGFFAHVFGFGTLWIHFGEEKKSFSYVKNGKDMTEKIVNHLKIYS